MSMDFDPSLLQDFLTESSELIEQLDQDLVQMESATPEAQQEVCNSCFRALHTIKGAASFLGLTAVTTFAHAAEDALNKMRKGEVALTPEIMDSLLQSADVVRGQVEAMTAGDPAPEGPQALIDKLHAIAEGAGEKAADQASSDDSQAEDESDDDEPGTKLELDPSKLDLLEFMTADLKDSTTQIAEAIEDLKSPASRAEAATLIQELIGQCTRTAEFFGLPELSDLICLVSDSAPILAELDDMYTNELCVRLAAAAILIGNQADAMDSGRLLNYPIQTLQKRITRLASNQELEEDDLPSHDDDANKLLVIDGVFPEEVAEQAEVETEKAASPENPAAAAEASAPQERAEQDRRQTTERRQAAPAVEQTIRVEVGRLESLLNMVGQLVLNKNRMLALTRTLRDESIEQELHEQFTATAGDLDRLTGELQVGVMRTRMQPLAKLFDRYPRVIRDIARTTGKKIDLIIDGKDTEVDKSVLEALADPLVHILRNSADHGVELPEDREGKGKAVTGTIRLSAEHQGSHVRVAIEDDGKGLSRSMLGDKAVEKGLYTREQLAQMTDDEVFRIIFAAGFSTAKQVSDLSGRGVGMDVVRTNIQKVNGEINIQSVEHQGTTIEILIPLTVAIMPAMVVGVGEHMYSIPLQCVHEIVKPEDMGEHTVSGYPVIRLRDAVLPLLDMTTILDEDVVEDGGRFAVVISVGGNRVGLRVDNLVGQQEIVIKPLDDAYTQGGPFSGATIREDGEVSLILDVARMVREASQQIANVQVSQCATDEPAATAA